MPFLDKTKYKNNVRTVIGTPQIYPDDVILLCDTTLGAVTINLLDIPTDYWNTQWQMYIVDISGNASVNNITINATGTQVINGAPSIVLNSNNAYANIRISGNGKYIATTSSSGGVSGHIIADEGVNLPQQPILDFVGAGVTASNGVGRTLVNISGATAIIPITNANLLTLVSTNSVVPGAYYLVTDPNFADEGVLVTGIINNGNTSVQGVGLYLNADYQNVGNYSGVVGFGAWQNIWKKIIAPIGVGDVVIYNNLHYKNLTGVNWDGANNPNADLINWQVLPKSVTNGYIRSTDFVYYDIVSNNVITRIDNKENEVDLFVSGKGENSLLLFQWGRTSTYSNKVKSGSLYYNCNSYCISQVGNRASNGGVIYDFTNNKPGVFDCNICEGLTGFIGVICNSGTFNNNNVQNGYLDIATNEGEIRRNFLKETSKLEVTNLITTDGKILGNELSNFSSITLSNNVEGIIENNFLLNKGQIEFQTMSFGSQIKQCRIGNSMKVFYAVYNKNVNNKIVESGFSNWEENLLFTDPTIWDAGTGTLTIPITFDFVGIFTTFDSNSVPVEIIVNPPQNHNFIIKPDSTTLVRVLHTPVGVAVPGNMLCDASPSTNVLQGRASGNDFVEYKTSGDLILRTNIVVVT